METVTQSAAAGRFIALEGVEGTGKSTQGRRLAAFLRSHGLEVVETREPGGTEIGERIRDLVLHAPGLDVPPETELFLILAARAAFVRRVVAPALESGAWVLSDRFDLSTLAYQGYGRRIDLAVIGELNRVATGGLVPDLYLLLDLDAQEGRSRQHRQGKGGDRIESEGVDFLARVRDGYVELAESRPEVAVVAAAGSPDEVEERVRAVVRARFPETFGTPAG